MFRAHDQCAKLKNIQTITYLFASASVSPLMMWSRIYIIGYIIDAVWTK